MQSFLCCSLVFSLSFSETTAEFLSPQMRDRLIHHSEAVVQICFPNKQLKKKRKKM